MRPEKEEDRDSVARAFAAFDGARYPLDGGSSKVLRFMLEGAEGCDATISPDAFEVRFGWHPSRHRYFLHVAPGIVSELLRLAGRRGPSPSVRARIGPATIPALQFPSWSFGERLVWMDRSSGEVSISVRDGRSDHSVLDRSPEPLPEPIAYALQFVDFPTALACPRCATPGLKYRRLQDGALVCVSCGRSFVLGDLP
jgi:hypothetical protein